MYRLQPASFLGRERPGVGRKPPGNTIQALNRMGNCRRSEDPIQAARSANDPLKTTSLGELLAFPRPTGVIVSDGILR